jgi:hypothetical protein
MLVDDPHDTFLRYSLAMEMAGEGDYEASVTQMKSLLADQPPYVPAFFMSAQHLVKLDRVAEARGVLREGIEQARAQGNAHAAGEMSEFLTSLGALGE